MQNEKNIILIIGGGGMRGIFSAGVLKSFEDFGLYDRIHSIYAVSVGGCTGARFLVRQSELGGKTFYTKFNDSRFIRSNFLRYFFQVLRWGKSSDAHVKSIFDFAYFRDVILFSEDKIDLKKAEASPIPLYVKVFNVGVQAHQYLRVEGSQAYHLIQASASMTPLTTQRIIIDGQEFFDGDSIPSDIDNDIVRNNPDKLIIRIESSKNSVFEDFNFFVLCIVYILLRRIYGSCTSNLYFRNFFKRPVWRRDLKNYSNVISIENDISLSAFCKDTELLKLTYNRGVEKGVVYCTA